MLKKELEILFLERLELIFTERNMPHINRLLTESTSHADATFAMQEAIAWYAREHSRVFTMYKRRA